MSIAKKPGMLFLQKGAWQCSKETGEKKKRRKAKERNFKCFVEKLLLFVDRASFLCILSISDAFTESPSFVLAFHVG